jgi:phosphoribosyl 1,2-cyclic phosphate phosphodiesterase
MKASFLFLGTSASAGIPMIGCKCEVCTSPLPENKRLRPAGLITIGQKQFLLDVGPDFHAAALKYQIDRLDGLLLTHTHYDHIAGIDELRIFYVNHQKAVPCLLSEESHEDLRKRYDYIFRTPSNGSSLNAQLTFQILKDKSGTVEFEGVPITYFSFAQIGMKVTGYRIGDFAYVSDIKDYDDSIFPHLVGVKTLVLSALKPEPSSYHLSFKEAVDFAEKVGAKQTWLTHVGHFYSHAEMNAKLPSHVQVARDGQKLDFTC